MKILISNNIFSSYQTKLTSRYGNVKTSRCSGKRSGSLRTRKYGGRSEIMSAYRDKDLPGTGDLDPPDYNEPTEIDPYMSEIEVEIDADIDVVADGTFEFTDLTVPWAYNPDEPSGDWYDHENNIYLGDGSDIAEYVHDIITPRIPVESGTYHVTGIILLVFEISNINQYNVGTRQDPEYSNDTSYVDVSFNFRDSNVESLEVE
ncbi:MAG: hypothetical protein K2M60_01055 [Lachnospiraceae bacterium]|nr:hypothetical protein [Lachnospiraceae bacterium]